MCLLIHLIKPICLLNYLIEKKNEFTKLIKFNTKKIKFIKLFAWENKWIQRTLDSREKELLWLRREQLNTVLLHAVFTAAPVLVAIISFAVFVFSGNELTVSTAFTVSLSPFFACILLGRY